MGNGQTDCKNDLDLTNNKDLIKFYRPYPNLHVQNGAIYLKHVWGNLFPLKTVLVLNCLHNLCEKHKSQVDF